MKTQEKIATADEAWEILCEEPSRDEIENLTEKEQDEMLRALLKRRMR